MKFKNIESIQSLAIVGATGLVGREFLQLLAEHKIQIPHLKLLASEESVGEVMDTGEAEVEVEELTPDSFKGVEVAFFSLPDDITKTFARAAIESGTLVVDDSKTFRMDDDVPLVVPEVNGALLRDFQGKMVSVPNCTTTPLAVLLKPLHEAYGVSRVVVSTYQSVSGAGTAAFEELSMQSIAALNGSGVESKVFPHPIAFNCIPQIGGISEEDGETEEEAKIRRELRKILDLPDLSVVATAIRVPTFFGHGLSVNVELEHEFGTVESLREYLEAVEGIQILDRLDSAIYPTNLECVGSDPTFVGRIRRDRTVPSGLSFWIMSDNLRKGAALNALQILETLYNYRRMS